MLLGLLSTLSVLFLCYATPAFQEGDIVFQTSNSAQSVVIHLATHSTISHCGIVFKENDQWYILEAVQPVKVTLWKNWVKKGKGEKYFIKRLKNKNKITPENLLKMKQLGQKLLGKDYDMGFNWSDDRLYCSELVWKIYQQALGITLCPLKRLKDFDLSAAQVRAEMKKRYGVKIPYQENVVAPVDIFSSDLLEKVD
jgi:hypothetical protein